MLIWTGEPRSGGQQAGTWHGDDLEDTKGMERFLAELIQEDEKLERVISHRCAMI